MNENLRATIETIETTPDLMVFGHKVDDYWGFGAVAGIVALLAYGLYRYCYPTKTDHTGVRRN